MFMILLYNTMLLLLYMYLSVLHEVVKQMVNYVSSEDTNSDTIRHLLCLPLHPHIKCQNHCPPVMIICELAHQKEIIKLLMLTGCLFLTELNTS